MKVYKGGDRMKSLMFSVKLVPSKEGYTIGDLLPTTKRQGEEWKEIIKETSGDTPIEEKIEYSPDPIVLGELVRAVTEGVTRRIIRDYQIPSLDLFTPIVVMKEVVEAYEGYEPRIINIIAYTTVSEKFRRSKA